MSDNNEQTGAGASELDVLKSRARLMNISFSNNIGVEALRAKINAKMEGEPENQEEEQDEPIADEPNGFDAAAEVADTKDTLPAPGYKPQLDHDHNGHNGGSLPKTEAPKKLTPQQLKMQERTELMSEQLKLVRCRIQNLDPKKANLPGEIFTVANRILGTIRKYVPYGEVTDDGYHLPYIIYRQLEDRRFLNIRTIKDRKSGQIRVENNWAKEFAIEVLPPLTQEELNRLASAQAAAGSVDAVGAN